MPKENTETVNPLMEKFSQTLAAAQSLEKQANKIYQKFIKASHTPELAKCLSPGSTDSDKHLQRIKLIQTSLGTKLSPSKKNDLLPNPKLKKVSSQQDLDIISQTLNLQSPKLAQYQILHPLASALNRETQAELLEQL